MTNEITNTQTPPAQPPAPPAGPSVEELKAKVMELEKSREGLIRDVQDERRKRQDLEQRTNPPAPSADPKPDVVDEEVRKLIAPIIDSHPEIQELRARKAKEAKDREIAQYESAKSFLVEKTGKKWDDIEADKTLQDKLLSVVQRFKLSGTPDDVTQRAFAIMELESQKDKEAERERANRTASNASMPSGAPPAPVSGGFEYNAEQFQSMSTAEYASLAAKGGFKKVGDKFVYTPR